MADIERVRRERESTNEASLSDPLFDRLAEVATRYPGPRLSIAVVPADWVGCEVFAWDQDASREEPVGFDSGRRGLKTTDEIVQAFEAWATAGFPA